MKGVIKRNLKSVVDLESKCYSKIWRFKITLLSADSNVNGNTSYIHRTFWLISNLKLAFQQVSRIWKRPVWYFARELLLVGMMRATPKWNGNCRAHSADFHITPPGMSRVIKTLKESFTQKWKRCHNLLLTDAKGSCISHKRMWQGNEYATREKDLRATAEGKWSVNITT